MNRQYIIVDDSNPWWVVRTITDPVVQGIAPSNYLKPLVTNVDDGIISWDTIELGELLGSGAYGSVHKAKWEGANVAIKILAELPEGCEEEAEAFKNEMKQLKRLRHLHVVR